MKKSLAASIGSSGRLSADDEEEDEASKMAIASYQAREEEIERRKMEVRERVESQLSRAEEEAKRLTQVWEELEVFTDPMRKDVSSVRKRLDMASRDLKSLQQICQKKVRGGFGTAKTCTSRVRGGLRVLSRTRLIGPGPGPGPTPLLFYCRDEAKFLA
ncbi:UNVERIFIED_CONTAM: hypothetical protein Sradi_6563600 [Sesamum radiatum]|uniref:RAB6-interacting golgin n=1 Tax=Sesamum radiatum TaxID=300843 RepID=A0AAW2JY91_SESRA